MNVNRSFFDIHKFILPEGLVRWKFVSGSHVLRSHDKLLRTIVLGADLQDEVARGRLSPTLPLTLIFVQQGGGCSGLGGGGGTCLCCSSWKHGKRNEHRSHGCKRWLT